MTVALVVAVNALVSLVQRPRPGAWRWPPCVRGAVPYDIVHFRAAAEAAVPVPLTLVTSMFLHGGLLHLAGNMLYLWIFGNNIEDRLGHLRFLVFYLSAAWWPP